MLTERLIPVSDTPSVSLFVAESAASSLRIYVDADARGLAGPAHTPTAAVVDPVSLLDALGGGPADVLGFSEDSGE